MAIRFRAVMAVTFLVGLFLLLASCGGSSRPAGILLSPSQGATLVDSFGINLSSGVLTQINTGAATGSVPSAIVLDPSGAFAYVANSGDNNLSAYSVNSNGTLTSAGGNAGTGTTPVALAMDSAGKFLFVANQGSNDVSVYSVGSGGALSEVAGSPFATGVPPTAIAPATATPAGVTVSGAGFVYVANQGQGTVSAFSLDSTTGVLTPVPGLPFAAGTTPTGVLAMTTASSTNVLFVANQGSNNISVFDINPDGSLTQVTGSPFSAGLGPVAIAAEPTHNFLYVADKNSNQLSAYRINGGDGALTPLNPATVSTGSQPVAVAVHPDGLYLYTANFGSDSISGFKLTTQTGVLTAVQAPATSSRPVGIALK